MSTRVPQRMSDAPAAPDARSFEGSTVRPGEKPAAAAYITLATISNVTAAMANEIAMRFEMGAALPMSVQAGIDYAAQRPRWVQLRQPVTGSFLGQRSLSFRYGAASVRHVLRRSPF